MTREGIRFKPERSGHCRQGARLQESHCLPDGTRRGSQATICKSGNLLGMWEALPVKRYTPNRRFAADASRLWVDEMPNYLRNVVSTGNEDTRFIPPWWVQLWGCCSIRRFWTSYRTTFRRLICTIMTQLSDGTPQYRWGLCFLFLQMYSYLNYRIDDIESLQCFDGCGDF